VATEEPLTVVIFDSTSFMGEALGRRFAEEGFCVIGDTSDYDELDALVTDMTPKVLVVSVDVGIDPESNLFEKARAVGVRTLIYGPASRPVIDGFFAAGADAYVLKGAAHNDLFMTLHQLITRTIFFNDGVREGSVRTNLTDRELEILRLVAIGQKNQTIADTLEVTEQTVKFHLTNIFRKLDVSNRTEAAQWAHSHGL
jgi:DNA-binding NarL/FixJ family response regulator